MAWLNENKTHQHFITNYPKATMAIFTHLYFSLPYFSILRRKWRKMFPQAHIFPTNCGQNGQERPLGSLEAWASKQSRAKHLPFQHCVLVVLFCFYFFLNVLSSVQIRQESKLKLSGAPLMLRGGKAMCAHFTTISFSSPGFSTMHTAHTLLHQ